MSLFKKFFSLVLALIMACSLSVPVFAAKTTEKQPDTAVVDEITMSYNNPNGRVLCVASLGNPRLYPENSIEGIKSAISVGADIVTVSIQKTKDNKFVLLSDASLSRMCVNKTDGTPATGKVSENTLEQLQSEYFLKSGKGGTDAKPTKYTIPSLEEAIAACEGKIMLMVNNGWQYAEELNSIARTLEACDIIIIRNVPNAAKAQAFIDKVGIPICNLSTSYNDSTEGSAKNFVTDSLNAKVTMVELASEKSYATIFNGSVLNKFTNSGRAFISTTEQNLCGGRDDLIEEWADLIERGYSVIETDYPKELASYIDEIESYRSELTSLIMQAQGLNTSKYTKDTTKPLKTALANAEELSGVGCVSLNEIDKARYDIQESIDNLVIRTGNEKDSPSAWVIILIVIVAILILGIVIIISLRIMNKKRAEKKKMAKFKDSFKNDAPEANDHLTGISSETSSNDEEPVAEAPVSTESTLTE